MKIGNKVVKHRKLILCIAVFLLIPTILSYKKTNINYDMLTYLPKDMETVKGQETLIKDFNKGGFSIIILENMKSNQVENIKNQIEKLSNVEEVLSLNDVINPNIPKEMLPNKINNNINNKNATLLTVFFKTSTSNQETLKTVEKIRKIGDKNTYVSGLSALVLDLKNLSEKEEPKYVAVAVILSLIAMMLLLDSYFVPIIFLLSIGIAIIYNLGTNRIFGEISYITKAIAAVLQLGVTMDYAIFLWHSYNEKTKTGLDDESAMAKAIDETLVSVTGSSMTTVAGFIALCFMTYRMGQDLGLVMSKGVIIGVICSVTILPALILMFKKTLKKTEHKSLIPDTHKLAHGLTSRYYIYIGVFILLLIPAIYGYKNQNIIYDFTKMMSSSKDTKNSEKLKSLTANEKLYKNFNINTSYIIIADEKLPSKYGKMMVKEIEELDGMVNVLGIDKFLGTGVPKEALPNQIQNMTSANGKQIIIANSAYKVSTDKCNKQIDSVRKIVKKYDKEGMVIGEGPATMDLIKLTDKDFRIVNFISIGMIFLIILFVLKSPVLAIILICVIEFAIIVNMGIPGFTKLELPFIVPICITTIQLGSTVDYAILMATRYKTERISGKEKRVAVMESVAASIPSIIVSALGFFTATVGVAIFSHIEIIGTLCNLMARGALISMLTVILVLPSFLMLFDHIICKTTKDMKGIKI